MNTIVVYYSGKGSNKYLAQKTAEALSCDLAELVPRAPGLVVAATATKLSFGNKPLKIDPGVYDKVILCGPIYMGRLAAPCTDFIKKYRSRIKTLDILSCCASTDAGRNETFGYGLVFDKLKGNLGSICGITEAFPIGLVLPEDTKEDSQAFMNTRLNDSNFAGKIRERFDTYIKRLI